MDAFYIKVMREFPPCPDSFLECKRFVNLAVHFIRVRSNLILSCSSYIMLLVGVIERGKGRKELWRKG